MGVLPLVLYALIDTYYVLLGALEVGRLVGERAMSCGGNNDRVKCSETFDSTPAGDSGGGLHVLPVPETLGVGV